MPRRPSRSQAEDAVRTLIRWAGDDPDREGLADTPPVSCAPMSSGSKAMASSPAETLGRHLPGHGRL